MTTKIAAALIAGTLTVGILVGAAGTILVHDATRPGMGMADMSQMHSMMSGMGGSMMDGAMGPRGSMDPGNHAAHHDGPER